MVTVEVGSRRQTIRELVRVQTNDPDQPSAQIFVTANVLVDVDVVPALLRFTDERATATVTLKNYTDLPVELNVLRASRHLDVALSALTIPPQGEVTVSARLIVEKISTVVQGNIGGLVEINTNLLSVPVIRIPIWARKNPEKEPKDDEERKQVSRFQEMQAMIRERLKAKTTS